MPKIVCINFDNYGYIFYACSILYPLDPVLDLVSPDGLIPYRFYLSRTD